MSRALPEIPGNCTNSIFDSWQASVCETFKSLSDEKRNKLLDHLIDICGARQLYRLNEKMVALTMRDFVAMLPEELSCHLLLYLDCKTLVKCQQVSKIWRQMILNCREVWRRAALQIGVPASCITTVHDAQHLQRLVAHVSLRIRQLEQGSEEMCETTLLYGHTGRVTAVYYRDGQLATGSDDRTVRFWDIESGNCTRVIKTHTVADLKFDGKILVTASFDATAVCWDINTGQCLQKFQGHIAAVFCIDLCSKLDLLVSGSADASVRLWSLSRGTLMNCLTNDNCTSWIHDVYLHTASDNDFITIIALTRAAPAGVLIWHVGKLEQHYVLHYGCYWLQDADFICSDTAVINWTVLSLLVLNLETRCHRTVKVNMTSFAEEGTVNVVYPATFTSYAYWRCGKIFHLCQREIHQIFVLKNVEDIGQGGHLKVIGTIPLPADGVWEGRKKFGHYFSFLGNMSWLDGFDGYNDTGVLLTGFRKDFSVVLLKWKPLDTEHARHVKDCLIKSVTPPLPIEI